MADIPPYCTDCKPVWTEAVRAAHLLELKRGLDSGKLSAPHSLGARELLDLAPGPIEKLPTWLTEAGVALKPLDWWHGHVIRVIKDLSEQGWWWRPSKAEPVLLQALPDARWAAWTGPDTELPHAAVLELFHSGEVMHVIRATSHRRHQRLCQVAREQLSDSEPESRFAALFVLMCVDPHPALTEFLQIASDPREHPRVRGLAVEALKECKTGVWFRESRQAATRRTWEALAAFILDPEPEVRWWACFIVGLMNRPTHRRPLTDSLRRVVDDPVPAGLGWSVGKAAQDALDVFEGREPPERLVDSYLPYDPWGLVT